MTTQPITAEITDQPRFPWLDLIIVLLVALALRMVHLYVTAATPIFSYLTYDSIYYHTVAQYIASGAGLGHEGVFKAPLYALLVALNYEAFGVNIFTTLFLQNVFGAISCGLIYLIALRLYSRKIALTAGLIAAAFGTLIYFNSEVLPITTALMLVLAALWLLVEYASSSRLILLPGAGLAIALAGAAMPETLVLMPAALWWLLRRRVPERVPRLHLVAYLIAIVVGLTPFAIRNYEIGREYVPFLTDVGVRLAISNAEGATGRDFHLPNAPDEPGQAYLEAIDAANRTNGREVPLAKFGGFWFGHAVKSIFTHPLSWLGLELRKLALIISGYEISIDKPHYFFAGQSPILRWLLWEGWIFFPLGLILPLAILGFLGGAWRDRQRQLLLFAAAALTGAILAFSPFSYERLLVVPVIVILAAAGFWQSIDLVVAGDYRRFYRNLAIFAISLVIVNGVIFVAGAPARVNSNHDGHLYTANAYMSAGMPDKAMTEFESALRHDPRSPRLYSGLAGIYLRQGNDSLAVMNYMRAAGLAPQDDRPYKGIVASYKRRQKITELNQLLVDVIRQYPRANWAFVEYADLHMRLQEYTQAADIYENAFRADTTYYDALFRKAGTYLLGDMRQEAEAEYERYLNYMPSSIEARANLGQVYARQLRLDLAEEQFEFVRRMQPYSPASYFNLSSLALQRGNFPRAYALLDTTRMINPNFPGLEEMRSLIDSLRTARQK